MAADGTSAFSDDDAMAGKKKAEDSRSPFLKLAEVAMQAARDSESLLPIGPCVGVRVDWRRQILDEAKLVREWRELATKEEVALFDRGEDPFPPGTRRTKKVTAVRHALFDRKYSQTSPKRRALSRLRGEVVPVNLSASSPSKQRCRDLRALLESWQREGVDDSDDLFEVVHALVHAPADTSKRKEALEALLLAARCINTEMLGTSKAENARAVRTEMTQRGWEPVDLVKQFSSSLWHRRGFVESLGIDHASLFEKEAELLAVADEVFRKHRAVFDYESLVRTVGTSEPLMMAKAIRANHSVLSCVDISLADLSKEGLEEEFARLDTAAEEGAEALKRRVHALFDASRRLMGLLPELTRLMYVELGAKKHDAERLSETKNIAADKRDSRERTQARANRGAR